MISTKNCRAPSTLRQGRAMFGRDFACDSSRWLHEITWDNMGRNLSDLDETWWKLFPGVSRSFLNGTGTKITAKKPKNMKFKIPKKNRKTWNFKNSKSRRAEVSQGRISTRRIRICSQKLKKMSVRAEKLDPKIPSLVVLVVLVVLLWFWWSWWWFWWSWRWFF